MSDLCDITESTCSTWQHLQTAYAFGILACLSYALAAVLLLVQELKKLYFRWFACGIAAAGGTSLALSAVS